MRENLTYGLMRGPRRKLLVLLYSQINAQIDAEHFGSKLPEDTSNYFETQAKEFAKMPEFQAIKKEYQSKTTSSPGSLASFFQSVRKWFTNRPYEIDGELLIYCKGQEIGKQHLDDWVPFKFDSCYHFWTG